MTDALQILDSNETTGRALRDLLQHSGGIDVQLAQASSELDLSNGRVDLLIVSGQFSVFESVMASGLGSPDRSSGIPVILLSSDSEGRNAQEHAWSFPYRNLLTTPFSFGQLLSLIHAVILRKEYGELEKFRIGDATIDPKAMRLTSGLQSFHKLTDMELKLLLYLHRATGEVVTREALLARVWGYRPNVETNTLDTHIYRLRQKIEPDPSCPRNIITEAGGYRIAKPT